MHSTLRFITNASKSANHLHISASSRIQISAALHEVNLMPSRHQNFTKVIGNKKQTHFLTVSFSIFRTRFSYFYMQFPLLNANFLMHSFTISVRVEQSAPMEEMLKRHQFW